jgi:hypothetical protein
MINKELFTNSLEFTEKEFSEFQKSKQNLVVLSQDGFAKYSEELFKSRDSEELSKSVIEDTNN